MHNLFSELNTVKHASLKKPIVRYFSNSSVLATEPLMDEVIADFCEQMDNRFATSGQYCPLDEWLKHCELPVDVSSQMSNHTTDAFLADVLKTLGTS